MFKLHPCVLTSLIGFSLLAGPIAAAQVMDTPATHAVIMDHATGTIMFSKNGEEPMIPASMTKMMTAYTIFEMIRRGEIKLTDTLSVSENAWRKGGFPSGTSTMGLKPKDTPTIEELLHGVIIMSGNDACIVLAEGTAGSEAAFAERMNTLAKEKGLKSLNFVNATGLEDVGHVVSAADLARLAKLTIDDYPEFYEWYNDPSYAWRDYTQPNRNPLLEVGGADGLKTGHLESSGYGLTASAIRDGVRRTIVIHGLPTMAARAQEAERMMKSIGPESVTLPEVPVWLGQEQSVPVSVASPVQLAGHKAALEKAKVEIVLAGPLMAPIKKGDTIGKLVITVEGQAPAEAPVIAEATVKKMGFFGRVLTGLNAVLLGGEK
jgi:serine-type D-Ala-D-Ala carboxypeptidase (penicillin-binding protein 5/6)